MVVIPVDPPCLKPMLHANFMALYFIEPELSPIEVLHRRNRNFRSVLLLWPWSWPNDLHIRTLSRYNGCANMNFLRQGFRKSSYCRHTGRQTDTTEIICYAASRVVVKAVEKNKSVKRKSLKSVRWKHSLYNESFSKQMLAVTSSKICHFMLLHTVAYCITLDEII